MNAANNMQETVKFFSSSKNSKFATAYQNKKINI